MSRFPTFLACFLVAAVVFALSGCGDKTKTNTKTDADKIKDNLALLSAEDREAAEKQKLCPIKKEPLGLIGKPIKLTLQGEDFFICCTGCKQKSEDDPDMVLAEVARLTGQK